MELTYSTPVSSVYERGGAWCFVRWTGVWCCNRTGTGLEPPSSRSLLRVPRVPNEP